MYETVNHVFNFLFVHDKLLHITKMADMPINHGKHFFFFKTRKLMIVKLEIEHRG